MKLVFSILIITILLFGCIKNEPLEKLGVAEPAQVNKSILQTSNTSVSTNRSQDIETNETRDLFENDLGSAIADLDTIENWTRE